MLLSFVKRFDFLLLTLYAVAINVPYFQNAYVPWHDTMFAFNLYHFFYSNLLFHNELAAWMPFDSFGILSNHDYLAFLSPVSYLMFAVGWIFKIKNVLLLFKLTILIEQIVFLAGLFLLGRSLFTRRSTVFLICIAALSSPDFLDQVFFDFRIFYLFPWAAYFLLQFFRQRQPEFLWLTGITLLVWDMGNVLYFVAVWLFILFVMFVILWRGDKSIFLCLTKRSVTNIGLLAVFILISLSYYLYLKEFLQFVDLKSRSAGAHNTLGMFLTWSMIEGVDHFFRSHFMNNPKRYIGMLPFFLFIWSVIKVRDKQFFAFLGAVVALLWFSFGGFFSALSYYFPTMSYYRHIGLVNYLLQIPLLVCAGFGWEHFWSISSKERIKGTLLVLIVILFFADAFRFSGHFLSGIYLNNTPLKDLYPNISFDSLWIKIGAYVIALSAIVALKIFFKGKENQRNTIAIILLMSAFFIDISSYQYAAFKRTQTLPEAYKPTLYTLQAHPMKFQFQRSNEPVDQRQKDAYALITRPDSGHKYVAAYSFLQLDSCFSEFHSHWLPRGFSTFTQGRTNLDQDLLHVVGCHAPKLRLMTQAVYPNSEPETMDIIRRMPQLSSTAVISGTDEATQTLVKAEGNIYLSERDVKIDKFSANHFGFDVNVPFANGAWLVYLDSYHPGWKAMVNGKSKPVLDAYLSFKAIFLNAGDNHVEFQFRGLGFWMNYWWAMWGLMSACLFLFMIGKCMS